MTWVTDLYNKIKNWQPPVWVKTLMQQLNDLMIAIVMSVGQGYIDYLKSAITVAAGHKDWSNDQKFNYVVEQAKSGFVGFAVTLKDSEVNLLVEFLTNQLKKTGVI